MRPWPGTGFAPAKPRQGAHAEVQFPGTSKHSHGVFGMPSLTKKTTAYVFITWPGGSASRTVVGDFRIRMVMEWVSEFNQRSDAM